MIPETVIKGLLAYAQMINSALTEDDLTTLETAIREKPDEIHWPTPDDPTLSWPREYNLIVKNKRRNFIISEAP